MASGDTVRQYNGHHKGLFYALYFTSLTSVADVDIHMLFTAAVCCALHDGAS
jgi:hypothetical protein